MIDNSWMLGMVMTTCFSLGVLAVTIKLLTFIFPKKEKKEKSEE